MCVSMCVLVNAHRYTHVQARTHTYTYSLQVFIFPSFKFDYTNYLVLSKMTVVFSLIICV